MTTQHHSVSSLPAPGYSRGLALLIFLGTILVCSVPRLAQAQSAAVQESLGDYEWGFLLIALVILPIVAIMVTSFVRIAIVLAILRSAIGARGVPPGYVICGLALVLTAFVMAPVGTSMYEEAAAATSANAFPSDATDFDRASATVTSGIEPLRQFLGDHSHDSELALFVELDAERRGVKVEAIRADGLLVLMPAFVLSELKEAFLIGFLVFLPFLVIDLVVSNILLSLGMGTLRPAAVSLPFKLLLFVLVDGWALLVGGLVQSYTVV